MYHDATAPNGRQHEAFLRFLVKLCRRLTVKRAPSSVSAHLHGEEETSEQSEA